jgi:tetratricopeptide (TPR) repeat protein
MTALVRMTRESALARQVHVRRWINEGLLLFAGQQYAEAAECFHNALDQQRRLDPIVLSGADQSHPTGCPTWKDLASPTLGFDAEPSLTVECLNNLSLCHLYSGNMHLAVQELEGLIREDPCLYLTEAVVFNLCTLYELGLDGEECARKKQLLQRVAKRFHLHAVSVESFRLG